MLRNRLTLPTVTAQIDLGERDDPPMVSTYGVHVTPGYEAWLNRAGEHDRDVQILIYGTGKKAVAHYIDLAIDVVEKLVAAGVPERVAHHLLPKELWDQLYPESK